MGRVAHAVLWLCSAVPALCALQLVTCASPQCASPAALLTWSGQLSSSDNGNGTASIVLRGGDELRDQYGRVWAVARTISATVTAWPLAAQQHQQSALLAVAPYSVRAVYETRSVRDPLQLCPPHAHCCVDARGAHTVRRLMVNDTAAYGVYRVAPFSAPAMRVAVGATIDGAAVAPSALQWRAVAHWRDESNAAHVVRFGVLQFAAAVLMSLMSQSPSQLCSADECFAMPMRYFGNASHSIGFTNESYAALAGVCESPLGYYASIEGRDQLDAFRFRAAATVAAVAGADECVAEFVAAGPAVSLRCPAGRVSFALRLDGVAAALQPRFALVRVVRVAFSPAPLAHAYAVVRHGGGVHDAPVALSLAGCTGDAAVAHAPHMALVAPGEAAALHVVVHGRSSSSVSCNCTVRVHGAGGVLLHSETISMTDAQPNATAIAAIAAALRVRLRGHAMRACTVDQGAAPLCTPVDCIVKYGGTRNWYNASAGRCEPVTRCAPDKLYDPTTNSCPALEQLANSQLPPPVLNASVTHGVPAFATLSAPNSSVAVVCAHGAVTPDGAACKCDSGWATDPNQQQGAFVFCATPFNGTTTGFGDASGAAPVSLIGVVTVVVLVLIVLLVVACVARCVCRARKRRRRRHRRAAEHERLAQRLQQSWAYLGTTPLPHAGAPLPENALNFVLPASVTRRGNKSSSTPSPSPSPSSSLMQSGLLSLVRTTGRGGTGVY